MEHNYERKDKQHIQSTWTPDVESTRQVDGINYILAKELSTDGQHASMKKKPSYQLYDSWTYLDVEDALLSAGASPNEITAALQVFQSDYLSTKPNFTLADAYNVERLKQLFPSKDALDIFLKLSRRGNFNVQQLLPPK